MKKLSYFALGLLTSAAVATIYCKKNTKKPLRKADHPIESIILNRWSPRAMSGKEISQDTMKSLLEAARWAPSSYNNQPWRFIYAIKGTPAFEKLFASLVPFNQSWAKNAGALVLVVSANNFAHNGAPSRTHSFDTGAATQNFALQGSSMGLVMHGMEGFDADGARAAAKVPADYSVEVMYAVGYPTDKKSLPVELQEREVPGDRKKVEEFAFEGEFKS